MALRWGEPLTYDDLQEMPDDGHRYELVDGTLLVSAAPYTRHQVCLGALYRLLWDHRGPADIVLMAPVDYVISQYTVLEPDLLVLRREDLGDKYLDRVPLLVVEILSRSTRRTDLGTKRIVYQDAGVPSYWIVDPVEPSLTVLVNGPSGYTEAARVVGDEAYVADHPFPVTVVPARLLDDLTG